MNNNKPLVVHYNITPLTNISSLAYGQKGLMPIAIIDVDNTLWDFATQLSLLFEKKRLAIPHWSKWGKWDFYKEYMPDKQFKELVATIHRNQRFHKPFKGASKLLSFLFKQNIIVYVISHRKQEFLEPLKQYLYKYDLPCDKITCSYNDKFSFIGEGEVCEWVIDDSPIVLERALELGIKNIMGLRYPWNEYLKNKVKLFDSMEEMNAYIQFKYLFSKGENNGSK